MQTKLMHRSSRQVFAQIWHGGTGCLIISVTISNRPISSWMVIAPEQILLLISIHIKVLFGIHNANNNPHLHTII